jgi:hypothetical protein
MSEDKKKLEVVFAPGCFDGFEGTQEELDELVAEIRSLVDSGEIFEKSNPLNIDNLSDEEIEKLDRMFDSVEGKPDNRLLN